MATLVLKLGTALLKQISKPAAKYLTKYVLERPALRQRVVYGARVRVLLPIISKGSGGQSPEFSGQTNMSS